MGREGNSLAYLTSAGSTARAGWGLASLADGRGGSDGHTIVVACHLEGGERSTVRRGYADVLEEMRNRDWIGYQSSRALI